MAAMSCMDVDESNFDPLQRQSNPDLCGSRLCVGDVPNVEKGLIDHLERQQKITKLNHFEQSCFGQD